MNSLIFFLSFGGTGVWTQVLTRQALYYLSHASIPFCVDYFWNRVLLYAQAGLACNYICASPLSWDERCMSLYPAID
jgi:hypothetical protein